MRTIVVLKTAMVITCKLKFRGVLYLSAYDQLVFMKAACACSQVRRMVHIEW